VSAKAGMDLHLACAASDVHRPTAAP
jgi:hypothetical protein